MGEMVVLSQRTEETDALNALAADRRELAVTIATAEPLRKGRNSQQKRRLSRLRADAQRRVAARLRAERRRPFRGRIAVEMRLALPTDRHDAGLSRVVKEYVDLLESAVVFDDARIDHLLVRLADPPPAGGATVSVRCLPVSIFAAEYDRAFKVLSERAAPAVSTAQFRDGARIKPTQPWGFARFDMYERELLHYEEQMLADIAWVDQQEADQLADDPEGLWIDLDLGSLPAEFDDPQVRDSVREHFVESTAFRRGTWMTDRGFDARDRPGPPPAWIAETVALDAADVEQIADVGPGCFFLPAPPVRSTREGELPWARRVERDFARGLAGSWSRARFRGPLALDIALRRRAGLHGDIDNTAHTVASAFTRAFEVAEAQLGGYRVYRQPAAPRDELRVRVMPAVRLDALARAIDDAREIVRHDRTDRARELEPV
jgi:hypothetical protein